MNDLHQGEARVQTRVEKKPSTAKRMIIMIVSVLVLIALIAGLKVWSIMRMMASFKPPPPAVVTTARAAYQEWQPELRAIGSLRALRMPALRASIPIVLIHRRRGYLSGAARALAATLADWTKGVRRKG